jgi:hypothetical protein
MGIAVHWKDEMKAIIVLEFESQWTWDDLYNATQQMYRMLDEIDHTAYTITDLRKSRGVPSGFLAHARRLTMRRDPRIKVSAIVGANGLVEVAVDIIRKVYKNAIDSAVFVDTLEEAEAIIAERRAVTGEGE